MIRRFTPTCVGKIANARESSIKWTVHPHMRGENRWLLLIILVSLGSPPHAWGKLFIYVY